jgi:cytochrome c-type biogenesis protein CcmF
VKATIKPGGSFRVGPYELVFLGLKHDETPHLESARAEVEVMHNGNPIAVMRPAKLFYKRPQQPATSVAIRSTPANDLYVVLASIDDDRALVTFQVFLTPLVFWLWAGGFIMAFGTLIVMWPNTRERAAIAAAVRPSVTVESEPAAAPGGD